MPRPTSLPPTASDPRTNPGAGPTVAEILELEPLRRGRPKVVAGAGGLGRSVRWTHVAEVLDIAHLLRGGELLLSTGIAFPTSDAELTTLVSELAAAGAPTGPRNVGPAGLVIELGRRYSDALPPALLATADALDLPVIELRRETSFVQVTEAVHALVVGAQLTELRASDEVHRAFTELSVEGADAETIVRHTARMANTPVVLENLSHQVLAFDPAGASADQLLDRWESRSRSMASDRRTTVDVDNGWVAAVVGARGTDWARLVLVIDGAPTSRQLVVAERAAGALALGRLVEREHESLELQSHRALLTAMVDQSMTSHELRLRASGLGVSLENRSMVAVIVRSTQSGPTPLAEQAMVRHITDATSRALRAVRTHGLVGVLDEVSVGLLLVATETGVESTLTAAANRIRRNLADEGLPEAVIAAGSTVGDVLDVRRSFLEASQVADLARPSARRSVHRLADVGLSGLLHLLRTDERVQTFVERELGTLLAYDAANDTDLLRALRVYLESGRNKSVAASNYELSRPAFYERLHSIEALLTADLDDVSTCLTLHVAVAALDAVRSAS